MIKIFYSKTTKVISRQFLDDLRTDNAVIDPFITPTVVIPNANLQRYLELYLAETSGVLFTPKFVFLESMLTGIIAELTGDNKDDYHFLSSKRNAGYLDLMVYHEIKKNLHRDSFIPVRNYISGVNKREQDAKIWQLSEKLAYLFREYEYKRNEGIANWLSDNSMYRLSDNGVILNDILQDSSIEDVEGFQREIYRSIYSENGIFSRPVNNKKIINLNGYYRNFIKNTNNRKYEKLNRRYYIFGLSNISGFHYKIIKSLSEFCDMYFYNLSLYDQKYDVKPLFEFEDENLKLIKSTFNDIKINYIEDMVNEESNEELNENYIENDITDDKKSKENMSDAGSPSLLKRFQELIFTGKTKRCTSIDNSIIITGACGIDREIITIYNSILYNLKINPDLQLNDIAIMVPDISKYKAMIKYIFDSHGRISYNLSDSNAKEDSVYGKAVSSLLSICRENFSRKVVFNLLYNRLFMNCFKLDVEVIDNFLKLCEDLNIFSNIKPDSVYSWRSGLRRLKFAKILDLPVLNDDGSFESFKETIPYETPLGLDEDNINILISIVERLINDSEMINNLDFTKPCGSYIMEFFDRYIKISGDEKSEQFVRKVLFERITLLDEVYQLQDDFEGSLDLLSDFLESVLTSMPSGTGAYLSGGINISGLLPMRPVPFKLVYLIGLGEKEFPGSDRELSLNLMSKKYCGKYLGDLTGSELNRYIFQEIVLSVKEKLILSYVCQDTEKDAQLYPSGLILKIVDVINKKIIKNDPLIDSFNDSSRDRSDDNDQIGLIPKILNIVETPLNVLSRACVDDHGIYKELFVNYDNFDLELIKTKHQKKKPRNFDFEDTISSDSLKVVPEGQITINLYQLKSYIYNPIENVIKRDLGLYEDEFDIFKTREDEPFYLDDSFERSFLSTVIYKAYAGPDKVAKGTENGDNENSNTIDSYIQGLFKYKTLQGKAVNEEFCESQIKVLKGEFEKRFSHKSWSEQVESVKYKKTVYSEEISDSVTALPFIETPLKMPDGKTVLLKGTSPIVSVDCDGNIEMFLVVKGQSKPHHLILPYLYYALLIMAGKVNSFSLLVSESDCVKKIEFPYLSKSKSEKYLQSLCARYLDSTSLCFAPFSIIDGDFIKQLDRQTDSEGAGEIDEEKHSYVKLVISDKMENSFSGISLSKPLMLIEDVLDFVKVDCVEIYRGIDFPIAKIFYKSSNMDKSGKEQQSEGQA